MTAVFFGALAAVAYVYFGYPALLAVRARLRPRPVRRGPVRPRISVIIAAFNEADVIERKIDDTLGNGYPTGQLEILVASDGSTDDTEPIVRRHPAEQVRLLALPRRGKVPALNTAAAKATGEVLVFTDADTVLEPGSLVRLVECFADPDVGGVTGRKVLAAAPSGPEPATEHGPEPATEPDAEPAAQSASGPASDGPGGLEGEGLYARYEEWQKRLEGVAGSTVASHGALHAVRRELYTPIEDPAVADDQAISARIVLQGYRLAYEPRAVVRVEPPREGASELRRKVRIANQVLLALFGLGPALWTSGFYSVQLVSHKLLRYLVPVFLIVMLASNAALALGPHTAWRVMLAAHLGFYGLAGAGWLLGGRGRARTRILGVPYYFCLVNVAALLALGSVLGGTRESTWNRRSGFHGRHT